MARVQGRSTKAQSIAKEMGYGDNPFIYFDHELFSETREGLAEEGRARNNGTGTPFNYDNRQSYLVDRARSATYGNIARKEYLNGTDAQLVEAGIFIAEITARTTHK